MSRLEDLNIGDRIRSEYSKVVGEIVDIREYNGKGKIIIVYTDEGDLYCTPVFKDDTSSWTKVD